MTAKKSPARLKRGPLSEQEKATVVHHKERHTAEQIAGRLRRPVSTVAAFLETLEPPKPKAARVMSLGEELETRPEWANFREQFNEAELKYFKYRYVQLMGQFREDGVLPTEEMQLYQVINLDILVQRTMREHKEVNDDMRATHERIEALRAAAAKDGRAKLVGEIRGEEINYIKCADQLKNLSARYESYMMRQGPMLKELKATRDQRVKILENSRQSFLGFLRLLNEEDQREALGREAGLMVAAADAAEERLRQPHLFDDGMTDQPLLTPEDVREY